MAKPTGFLAMWFVVGAVANCAGEVVDDVPAYLTPTGVSCGKGFAYWDGSK